MAEETQEELMERVKKMSPEELLEFQKSRCIFCQIIQGKIQSKKIYEDDKIIGILDINPANPGHILLMPKEHYAIMPQVPMEIIEHLFLVSKRLCNIGLKALGSKGTTILVQNGLAAGQKAQHFMIHLIPRMDNDGVGLTLDRKEITEKDYIVIKERIQKKVNEVFGVGVKDAEIINEINDIDKIDKEVNQENNEIESIQKELNDIGNLNKKKQEKEVLEQENNQDINDTHEDNDIDEKKNNDSDEINKKQINTADLDDIAKVLGIK
ncbi:MAG: HIT family protein [Candidatus Woesearchaeota archaeon]